MGQDHFLGEFLNYMQPIEFNTLKQAFTNKNLSENAKFICYSIVVGMLHQEVSILENQLKKKKEQLNDPWKFRFSALIDWYENIFTEQQIIDAFKELQQNNVYLTKEFDLQKLLDMEREAKGFTETYSLQKLLDKERF